MARHSLSYQILERCALAYRRADSGLRRVDRAGRAFASALLDRALSDEEKGELGFRLYDQDLGREVDPGDLFDWERRWLARELPAAPGRILVGGAGAGREVRALRRMGYVIDALEPAPRAAALCRRHVGDEGEVLVAGYAELCRGELSFNRRRYDAVLLGWGSLTHVLSESQQQKLLMTASALTPHGPLLASFWTRSAERPTGRAHALGVLFGSAIGRSRGQSGQGASHVFVPWGGFNAPRTVPEIEALADAVGRRLRWDRESGGFPRATFLAPDA